MHLHTAAPDKLDEDGSVDVELNMQQQPSKFRIVPVAKHVDSSLQPSLYVRGGDYLAIRHTETGSFLSAQGLLEDPQPIFTRQRVYSSQQPMTGPFMWRLEELHIQWGGTQVSFDAGADRDRVSYTMKNIVTNTYLADTAEGVKLHSSHNNASELWTLVPFQANDVRLAFGGGNLRAGRFCLKNVATERILRYG